MTHKNIKKLITQFNLGEFSIIAVEGLVPNGDKSQINTWLAYNNLMDLNAEIENDMLIPRANLAKLFHKIIQSKRHHCTTYVVKEVKDGNTNK